MPISWNASTVGHASAFKRDVIVIKTGLVGGRADATRFVESERGRSLVRATFGNGLQVFMVNGPAAVAMALTNKYPTGPLANATQARVISGAQGTSNGQPQMMRLGPTPAPAEKGGGCDPCGCTPPTRVAAERPRVGITPVSTDCAIVGTPAWGRLITVDAARLAAVIARVDAIGSQAPAPYTASVTVAGPQTLTLTPARDAVCLGVRVTVTLPKNNVAAPYTNVRVTVASMDIGVSAALAVPAYLATDLGVQLGSDRSSIVIRPFFVENMTDTHIAPFVISAATPFTVTLTAIPVGAQLLMEAITPDSPGASELFPGVANAIAIGAVG